MIRHSLFIMATAILFLGSCGTGQSQTSDSVLSATAFAEKIKLLPSAPIIDVRTPEEFSKGHLQNAQNINVYGNDFATEISKLDKSNPVFVYCLSGGRSAEAASQMRSDGFKEVYELEGGMMSWRSANLPETEEAQATGMSKSDFDSLLNTDKLVLIDFYADWCAPCKKMKPYFDEISDTMSDKVSVIRINADEHQQLCRQLNIDGLPVVQLYKNKKLTWSHTGYISKEDILKQLD